MPFIPCDQVSCFSVSLVAGWIAQSFRDKPYSRQIIMPREILCGKKCASTHSAMSNFRHNEDFVDHQQVEVWSRIDRQERNLAALVIQDVVPGVPAPRTAHCSVTERVVSHCARIHYLDDLKRIWRHALHLSVDGQARGFEDWRKQG